MLFQCLSKYTHSQPPELHQHLLDVHIKYYVLDFQGLIAFNVKCINFLQVKFWCQMLNMQAGLWAIPEVKGVTSSLPQHEFPSQMLNQIQIKILVNFLES